MPVIEVLKDFVLTLDDHTRREFKKGEHEVEQAIADHWYVKAHSTPVEPAAATPISANPTPLAETPTPPAETAPEPESAPPKKK